ncbi:hypothetical protein MHYP_G00227890 [Metynnis hypsauchen]
MAQDGRYHLKANATISIPILQSHFVSIQWKIVLSTVTVDLATHGFDHHRKEIGVEYSWRGWKPLFRKEVESVVKRHTSGARVMCISPSQNVQQRNMGVECSITYTEMPRFYCT